jgi:outer membrane protein TolC
MKMFSIVVAIVGVSAFVPVAAAAQELTLDAIYAEARARSPLLRAAEADAVAVRSREGSVGVPPDPQFQIGIMNASLPDLGTAMPASMAPSIRLMQMVPFPGKLGLSAEIAKQTSRMAKAGAAETWWEVRARAAMAFYEVYALDRQIDEMRETLRLLEDFEQVAKAMYAAGEGRQSDVLRASVEVTRAGADVTRMEAMRAMAVAALNATIGRAADMPVPAVALPALPADVPSAQVLIGWAEETRPMLEQGRIDVERADARLGLARRELWPDLTIGVEYGQRRSTSTAMDGAAERRTERMASLMVGFSVPIFAGRRQLRMRTEMEAMRRMTEAELADMRVQVGARIGQLLAELDRDRTLIGLYRTEVLPQAEATVTSALMSYRVGKVDFMTLVDAQMAANEYRQELIGLLADYGRAIAELEMTIGRELRSAGRVLVEDR